MASSSIATARWRTLSSNVGIPIGRVSDPLPFGMCTRRTGGARYVPDLARSSSDRRFSSNRSSYCLAVCPSTPLAPSLRVRLNASRNQSISMWCAREVNAISGASLASIAIRCSFVETLWSLASPGLSLPRFCDPALPSLRGVPRDGSPASQVQWSAPTSYAPDRLVCLVRSVPSDGASFALVGGGAAAPASPGVGQWLPSRILSTETEDLPGSWEAPLPSCPALGPRWAARSSPNRIRAVLPAATSMASATTISSFRGSITRPVGSLSTLRSLGHPRTTQDSLPACWLGVGRAGLSPAGLPSRISEGRLPPFPSSQAFSWRKDARTLL